MDRIPFTHLNWESAEKTEHPGSKGTSTWFTLYAGDLRLRKVHYSAGYVSDHWCSKGHVVHCLDGEFICEQEGNNTIHFSKGMSYVVSDNEPPHRSSSVNGATLLIIDGDFLKTEKQEP
jgi:hypothetical protein